MTGEEEPVKHCTLVEPANLRTALEAAAIEYLDVDEHLTADVFIRPIGGHYTMDRHEAAAFADSISPNLVLPVHYDMFEAIETGAEAFTEDVESNGPSVRLC